MGVIRIIVEFKTAELSASAMYLIYGILENKLFNPLNYASRKSRFVFVFGELLEP